MAFPIVLDLTDYRSPKETAARARWERRRTAAVAVLGQLPLAELQERRLRHHATKPHRDHAELPTGSFWACWTCDVLNRAVHRAGGPWIWPWEKP